MSLWTHVRGQVIVSPIGRTQPEKEYILKTVLEHLPIVTGSEEDMQIHIGVIDGHDRSSSHDEFGMRTDKAISFSGYRTRRGMFRTSSYYYIDLYGDLRDREFEETQKEIVKWLCRLAKRCTVEDIIVSVDGESIKLNRHMKWVETDSRKYYSMFEQPSWCDEGTSNWCEYLMWDRAKNGRVPLKHSFKYEWDEEDKEECLRRMRYEYDD